MATVHHPAPTITATPSSAQKNLTQSISKGCNDPILVKIERRERIRMGLYFIIPMITIAGAMVLLSRL